MVTKYDVFEIVYKNKAPLKPIEVVKELNKDKREYHIIHRHLRELAKENLLEKKKDGFQTKISEKSELLYNLIFYTIKQSLFSDSISRIVFSVLNGYFTNWNASVIVFAILNVISAT